MKLGRPQSYRGERPEGPLPTQPSVSTARLEVADKDLEKIELLEAQNRALWQQVEEARG